MTRKSEIDRLVKLATESDGYVAKPCAKCSWWRFESGDKLAFERDYTREIRCKCQGVV